MDYYIIDRVEGEYVVCELASGEHVNYLRKSVPKNAKEGDVLILRGTCFLVDQKKTDERRKEILALQQRLLQKKDEV